METSLLRVDGWEARLFKFVDASRARPFVWGENDCFSFACGSIQALTGVDRWSEWKGRYSSPEEAWRLISRYADVRSPDRKATFIAGAEKFFQCISSSVKFARRGDVVAYPEDPKWPALGISLGEQSALLTTSGIRFLRTVDCQICWRVG